MRLTIVSPTDIMEGQLQTTRNAHLIKDPKQIVTNCVFTQIELLRDVTIWWRPSATRRTIPSSLFVNKVGILGRRPLTLSTDDIRARASMTKYSSFAVGRYLSP